MPAAPASALKIKGRGCILVTRTRLEEVARPEDPSFETFPVQEHTACSAALSPCEGASFPFPAQPERRLTKLGLQTQTDQGFSYQIRREQKGSPQIRKVAGVGDSVFALDFCRAAAPTEVWRAIWPWCNPPSHSPPCAEGHSPWPEASTGLA